MFKKISYILSLDCPLLQALEMIEMMVDYRYMANRHHWTEPEAIVKKNLRIPFEKVLKEYGFGAISDDFFEYFSLHEHVLRGRI